MAHPAPQFDRKDEELERLKEVHSDVRTYLEDEHKHHNLKLIIWFLLLSLTLLFAYLETTQKTHFFEDFFSTLNVSGKDRPKDGNMIPMPFTGNTPLLVPQDVPTPQISDNIVPPASESAPADKKTDESSN